ncbi:MULTISPECIES: SIMPL domain-containing protein [unclassified Neisseria]|uniref:SIMPL domain-containing protein n=1 Tax=unclassified Neisseria TaxID=2623750 RepID=UPI002665F963|nr:MULTISPECIES: SIMPL domain-containing protein [unclassified Neisseria]MDO1510751.1 SIMPL domain-containing protein [Neisseria sp. MVDL19-042950]MDO1517041.1 SIMPL domain-containing protein [Neisseria sp. MVDL18-041461]MDO1564403.1 SIMPL domain-containing protein [Neisseria sp. MVDL20-010259]
MLKPALILAAVASTAPPAAVAEPLNYNIVEFAESASLEIPRDTMSVFLRVHEEGRNRNAVNTAFMKKFNNLNRKTATGSDFKTELLFRKAFPRYEYTNNKRVQSGWEEEALIKVTGKNFDALNNLIASAQNEANLDDIRFSVSKEKREDAVDRVSKAALLRFKDRASTLTKIMGFNHYKIVRIDLGQIGNRSAEETEPMMMRSAKSAMAEDAAALPETTSPGMEEISITVRGSIQM